MECQYALMQFGIRRELIPMDHEGNLIYSKFYERLEENGMTAGNRDAQQTPLPLYQPQHNDVLFGRGKPVQYHTGNVLFLQIVDEFMEAYNSARRNEEKKRITLEIIQKVKDSSARFLKRNKDGNWTDADDEETHLKVTNAFRTLRHAAKKNAATNA
jgi:hypothetical protein